MNLEKFDVTVIGGGSAGLAAAVSAARSGARTLLIERYGYLGGMGTASLVHTICGLYLLRDEPGAVLANGGFPAEFASLMIAATGMPAVRMGRVDVLPQHPVEFVMIADRLIEAEQNLEVRLHTEVVAVTRAADTWEIQTGGRGGTRGISSRTLIDASGDAEVAMLLGADAAMAGAPRLQRPAYVFGVQGVENFDDQSRLHTGGVIVQGIREGELTGESMGLTFRASGRPREIFGTLDLTGGELAEDYDPFDPGCLTTLETRGRKIAASTLRWLCSRDPAWKNAYISHWPVRAGVRESRRWMGESVLKGDDLAAGRRFADEVGLATWPMEFRETAKGPKLRYPEGNRPCGIPAGCLVAAGIDRLFIAGRCISTDHEAQASIRVMGTCFVTGEAAGQMAAAQSSG